jgi:hypothetical protein
MPGEKIKQSKFMQRCVADVTGQGKDTAGAFAICTAQQQKAGLAEPGSRKLTKKGKRRERQFGREKDMGDKQAAYLAATGRAEEAMDEFTWKKIVPAVTLIMARNKMNDWGKPTGPHAVFAASGGAAFVTLIDVRKTRGAGGEHEGQFTIVAGIPSEYDWSDLGREEKETRAEVAAAKKGSLEAIQRLMGPLEDVFEVRKFGTMIDLLGWRDEADKSTRERKRFQGEGRGLHGLLSKLDEAVSASVQVAPPQLTYVQKGDQISYTIWGWVMSYFGEVPAKDAIHVHMRGRTEDPIEDLLERQRINYGTGSALMRFQGKESDYPYTKGRYTGDTANEIEKIERAGGTTVQLKNGKPAQVSESKGAGLRGILTRLDEATERPKETPKDLVKILAKHKDMFDGILFDAEAPMSDQKFADTLRNYAWLADRWTDEELAKDPREAAKSVLRVLRYRDQFIEADEGPDVKGIAHEILRQLGGRKFLVMTGAKDLIHAPTLDAERKWPTLSMKLPIGKAKGLRIALAPSDTYTVQFMTRGGKVAKELDDIYADQLADVVARETGLALSL